MSRTRAKRARGRLDRGFTLIEMIAVVLVMALISYLVIPGLGTARQGAMRAQAIEVASTLEFTRQRAVMTRRPHRVLFDLESGSYRVEWFVADAETSPAAPIDFESAEPLDLGAPPSVDREYHPIPSQLGAERWMDIDFFIDGIDTPDGYLQSGEVAVVFQDDGSTDAAEIVIVDDEDHSIVLVVRPLLDLVRIVEDA